MIKRFFWFLFGESKEFDFHPVYNIPIKAAFKIGKKTYYQCVNDYEMPAKRFGFATKFYGEMQNRITAETLIDFCEAGKNAANKGELGVSHKLWEELEYRAKWLFEPESLLRFASVVYFTLDENLQDYDFEYNAKKMHLFEKKKMHGLFLRKLFAGDKIPSNLSETDLEEYLSKLRNLKGDLRKYISEKRVTNSK